MAGLASVAHDAVKRANSSCSLIGCGFEFSPKYQEDFFKAGGLKYLDGVSLHPYFVGRKPESAGREKFLLGIKKRMRGYGTEKPVYVTEVGSLGTNTFYEESPVGFQLHVPEEEQADTILKYNVIALANGVERFLTFLIAGGELTTPFHYGLTRFSCAEPKAALPAYATMTRLLDGAVPTGRCNLGTDL